MRRNFTGIGRYIVILLVLQMLVVTSVYAQDMGVKEVRLDNGLTVLMKEVHAAPVITAQVWFDVGSRNEYTGITGVSHLLEHMLFNSSKNYKKGDITRLVRERGGIENAATWTDFTYYWQLISSEQLDFTLKALAERVGNALLLEEEFEKERTVVLSELDGGENNPDRVLYQALMATAFNAHPYHWPTIGWRSDVENVSVQQLRDYYKAYYHPNNATLVLVGDFDSDKALALVKKYFGPIPKRELPRPVYTTEPPQRGEREVIVRKEGNAERIIIGYKIPDLTHPDTYPLMVLDQILSGGRSSRLYQALVDKGLAVGAWSSSGGRKDPALFMFGATGRQGVTADQLKKALLEQVELAKTTLPTDQEMQAARNQLESYLIFQNDSVSDQGEQLGSYATVADWRYLETLIPRIKAVTPEEVETVARKYFTSDSMTVAKFIPTNGSAPAAEGSGPAIGPIHNSTLENESTGLEYREAPAPAAPAAKPVKEGNGLVRPTVVTLDNGMTVIVQENHANATVAVAGNLKAGSYFDPEGKTGVAELVADMVSRGTNKRTSLQIAQETEYVGASVSVSQDVEATYFNARSLAKDFPLILDVLSDELRNASFTEEEIAKARGEMASQLEQGRESTEARAFRAFHNSVFPEGHAYHEPTIEQAQAELKSITRDDLVSFYNAYYRPDTTILVIVGDVDTQKAVDMVKKYFGDWKAAGPKPEVNIPTIQPQKQAEKIVIPMMDKSEVDVVYGYALGLKRSDPDFYAVRIMNQILGGAGALASILGEDLREKQGLVYGVYSTYDAGLGAGPWYASLGTNPKNADQAVQSLQKQIAEFRENGATEQQYRQAREFIIGVFPVALETNAGVARALLSAQFYGLGMDYLQNYADYYRAVSLEDVNAAAKKYLHPETGTLVIAGPYEEDK